MAPRLEPWQHELIRDMIQDREPFTNAQIAEAVRCTPRSIRAIRSNLRCFRNVRAPANGIGRRRGITPPMLEALREHHFEKPDLYQDEMVVFLWDEFRVLVTIYSIGRALASIGWTKKAARRIAREQNAELRDYYLHSISSFRSFHLVYVDESGCDKQAGFRRTGWSPSGVIPVQIARFHRGQRYQILPAYAQDGVVLSRVFRGSTDTVVFEDFIRQLLHHCGRWPEPKSVIVMDNASFHRTESIKQMCSAAGVKLVYLPPYSPDLNPIEEFFAELKAFIKRRWLSYAQSPDQGFNTFLEWCVDVVGAREKSAQGHFRHAGWSIEKP